MSVWLVCDCCFLRVNLLGIRQSCELRTAPKWPEVECLAVNVSYCYGCDCFPLPNCDFVEGLDVVAGKLCECTCADQLADSAKVFYLCGVPWSGRIIISTASCFFPVAACTDICCL